MTFATVYLITFAVFLGFDYLGLSYIIKPTFERALGDLLLEDLRLGAALAFYAFYVAVLVYFIGQPALQDQKSLGWVFFHAALLGAMSYGTYEFTNMATLKDWTWTMVATDLTWGTVLTGVSATIGVWGARAILS